VHQVERPPADSTRTIRAVAWRVITALAAFQAYAHRYAISPDGISYLDLSDAVVGHHWSRLVNLYWSPLYPALVGIARAVSGASPALEVPAMHAVNFVSFLALFGAFEYSLASILALASRTRDSILAGPWGLAGAYALFAFFALTMLPQELTTPDVLSGAAMFLAFGALLRLRDGSAHDVRDAAVLGIALGLGALTKSFLVPWAIVCLAVLFVATRGRGARLTLVSGGVWALIVVPWTMLLTRDAGRFTFGDTGRLTYAWYVNGQDVPSLGGVPAGARTARADAILPGVGVTGPAPGTDPAWFDPARWNASLEPHWNMHDQLRTFDSFQVFYVQSLTPLLFLILLVTTAPRGSRRGAWWNGWVVYVPAVAGIAAYSLVLVTARYVMPFVLAATLTLLATLPRPRRMLPLLAVLGVVIPVGLEAVSGETIIGLTLVASVIAAMAVGSLVPTRWWAAWGAAVIIAFLAARIVLPPSAPDIARMGAVILTVSFWFSARAAIRNRRPIAFAHHAAGAMALILGLVLALRLQIRIKQDVAALRRAQSTTWGNAPARIAADLAARGIGPGTLIALIGPHAESYWARTGRLNIVANVPAPRAPAFWQLSPDHRDALLQEFAAAGATVAIASIGPDGASPDSSWIPVRYHGWIWACYNFASGRRAGARPRPVLGGRRTGRGACGGAAIG
jgi:hypothetical protein